MHAPARHRRLVAALTGAVVLASLALSPPRPLGASEEPPFPVQLVRVTTATHDQRDRLTDLGLDLTEHGGDTFVDVVLHSEEDAARLVEHGFAWTVVVADLGAREVENQELNRQYAAATDLSPLPSGRDTYRTLTDYETDLRRLADDHPDLVRLLDDTELPHRSLENRIVYGVEISDDVHSTDDGRPVFLMLGLHHAREWPSGEHSMEFAVDLVQGYGSDPRITDLLQRARVIVVPVVNPDGFEQSRKWGDLADLREVDDGGTVSVIGTPGNAYKRKNCRAVDGEVPPPGSCEVASPGGFALGVDLNRNYGGLWGGAGASALPAHATYRGAEAFSEPETENIRALVSSRHVTTLITNHTYSNLVLRPPGVRAAGETVDEPAMKDLGARMTANNGYRNIHGWQLYDTSGTTEDWSYNATGGYGYTFEIGPHEFHPPFGEVVDEYVGAGFYDGKGNREAYLVALENAVDTAHHSVIAGKAPAGAVLRLKKAFSTKTSQVDELGNPRVISDTLESTLTVPAGSRYTWHVNPSTRPEVMEHRLRILAEEPTREETFRESAVVWLPGDHRDVVFAMPETDVGALRVTLDWPTPDDLDLYVYHRKPDGSLVEVGSSGNFILDKEEALVELPEPGDYVLRVVNYASVSTEFTVTAGLYGLVGEDAFGDDLVESYTLSCETSAGRVLETTPVVVDRGKTQKVDLKECARAFRK
ncbi:MAG: zinc carboxypeptidase [Actinobacteria bacterium]|nr:zinc carboxypeptidase [Actinomycetota bacterium]